MNLPKRVLRVGLVDSGIAATGPQPEASRAFGLVGSEVVELAAVQDRLGHGSQVAEILLHHAPDIALLSAQVFHQRLTTTAAQVAAAIDWLVSCEAHLINLSLGLLEPRPVLANACARALAAGVVLCAATPARGQKVYPAGFAGVLRITGDARCGPTQFAALAAPHADFGAHVRPLHGTLAGAGASMACAHLSGIAASHLEAGSTAASLPAWLAARATFHGMDDLRKRQHGS